MKEISIGDAHYRLIAEQRDAQWTAHAERAADGERFGADCGGGSEAEATGRLALWLQWQHEHRAALEVLQRAEHAYHRTVAGSAFAGVAEAPSVVELQRESLDQVEAARVRLDEVRARKPEF